LILTASLTAQIEHAPTAAQCQADQRLWLSKIEENPNSTSLPAYSVLTKWELEMGDCQKVDPKNQWVYFNTATEALTVQASRLENFITRHNLYKEFIEEDAAGKR
jgi:hypothetical protein